MKRNKIILIAMALSFLTGALPAVAATETSYDEWLFSMTPLFLGVMNMDGSSPAGFENKSRILPYADDVFENPSPAFKIHVEAQKNDWTLFTEYQYLEVDSSTQAPHGFPENNDLRAQITELGASYLFATWEKTDFEVLAGTRYKINESPGPADIGSQSDLIKNDEWWRNAFVGLRFFSHLSENWTFIGRGDIGAGTGGRNISLNFVTMLDYRFEDWGSVYFGYKWLDFDYENVDTGLERYTYDALQQGPFIGMSIRW